ncbi:prepilin peptidase [Candidatus Daviesbacteria bacterium]|nr:prepilin peptidase [Candidatus Daviesbacteria bacterium]
MEIFSLGFIFGAILGSFTKALADRSLTKVSFFGRSYCNHCQKQLVWYDLFPIISYLLIKGKCRYCKKAIPLEYLLVEVLMGVLIAWLFLQIIPTTFLTLSPISQSLKIIEVIFKSFVLLVLVSVFLTDIKKGLIPDRITYPAVMITFIYLVALTIYKSVILYFYLKNNTFGKFLLPPHSDYFFRHVLYSADPLISGVLSALGLGLFFGLIIILTKGRGMGGGDLKLAIFMGLTLGFPSSLVAIILAFLSGSIVGLVLLVIKIKRFGQTIPFGPFLALGSIMALFWGQQIYDWYLNFSKGSIF